MWDQWLQSMGQASDGRERTDQDTSQSTDKPTVSATAPSNDFSSQVRAVWHIMPWWRWGLAFVGSMCLLLGLVVLVQSGQVTVNSIDGATAHGFDSASASSDVVNLPANSTMPAAPSQTLIFVDVSGAVVTPGVYQVEATARAGAAVAAAGGFTAAAHQVYLTRFFNAAASLTDGQKIYIPFAGEEVAANSSTQSNAQLQESASPGVGTSIAVSINTATGDELDTLPGIGSVRAKQIIEGRPYQSLEELRSRKIVTESIYQGLTGLICL